MSKPPELWQDAVLTNDDHKTIALFRYTQMILWQK